MRKIGAVIAVLVLIQLAACLRVNKFEKPIVHYQLAPDVETVTCKLKEKHVLEVMPVLVVSPYDGTRLIYSSFNFKVEPSVYFRWITPPADMIRDYLVRSLKTLSVFENVIQREGVLNPDYLLETRVSRLDCLKTKTGHVARFEVDVVLIQKADGAKSESICFKSSYKVLERVAGKMNPPDITEVVKAMNAALKKFGYRLQKDLCVYFSKK